MRGIWARTCVLAERRGNAAAICEGRICAQAGYRAVCGGYAICGAPARSQAGAPAQAARQSAARNGVGMAEWPIRHALCSGRIDAQAGYRAACGGYTICGAFVLSQSVAIAQAARQSAARNGVGRAAWPTRRAICSGLIDAQAGYHAACGGYTICGAFVLSRSVAPAQAARQSAARTGVGRVEWPTRRALYPVALRSGGLSRRL